MWEPRERSGVKDDAQVVGDVFYGDEEVGQQRKADWNYATELTAKHLQGDIK